MPPGPTCNGLELMAEFRQMWLPTKNGGQIDHKDPTATNCSHKLPQGEPPPKHGRPRHTQSTGSGKHLGTLVPATWCYQAPFG